jgi:hypothetical protein
VTTHLPDQRFDTTSTAVDLVESYLANDFGTVLSTHYHQYRMLAEKKERKIEDFFFFWSGSTYFLSFFTFSISLGSFSAKVSFRD